MPPLVEIKGKRASTIGKGRQLYQGSATEKSGVSLEIPLKKADGDGEENEAFVAAEFQAFRGLPYLGAMRNFGLQERPLPSPVVLGEPRVYAMRPQDKDDAKVLHLRASKDWWRQYQPLLNNYLSRLHLSQDSLMKHESSEPGTAKMMEMFDELQDAARAKAAAQGYPFFTIQWDLVEGNREQLYMTAPDSVKVVSETPVGVLPGMKEMPRRKDLVLYHGGPRKYGVVELDHRPTGEGEGLDPVPYLRHSPAIWASSNFHTASGYSLRGGKEDERQVYYLDAPAAMVGEVQTGLLNRLQANAVIEHLMESDRWKGSRPDILQLERGLGGTEYFIPEGYTPGLVRVTKPSSRFDDNLTVPSVTVGETNFAAPSDNFCQVMQAEAANSQLDDELVYWTERCEESRPIAGRDAADSIIARLERLLNDGVENYAVGSPPLTEPQREITKARIAYWKAYRANLEKTKSGYRLKDPAVLAKPEIKLLESVYGKAAPPAAVKKASGKPTVAKKAVAVKKAASKPKKAAGTPTVASGKAAAGKPTVAAGKAAAVKKAPAGGVAPKKAAGKAVAVKKAVKPKVAVKAAPGKAVKPKSAVKAAPGKAVKPKSAVKKAAPPKSAVKKAAPPKSAVKKAAPPKAAVKAAPVKKAAVAAKPKAAPAGDGPPKRRRKPKEPVVAGKLPTVSITR